MKRKLLSLTLLVVAFCLLTPCVSANAQINHDKQTMTSYITSTDTFNLEAKYYPYTQAKLTVTFIGNESYMYNQVTDAKGYLHINGKASFKGFSYTEGWAWDDERHEWVLAQQTSQSEKIIIGYNALSFDSKMQTSKQTTLYTYKNSAFQLDLESGQILIVDAMIIHHLTIKYHNGELQFQKSFEISNGVPDL